MNEYAYRMTLSRPEILTGGASPGEEAALTEHFARQQSLTSQGAGLLAGRTLPGAGSSFSVAIFRAEDEQAARQLVEEDPAVRGGVLHAERCSVGEALESLFSQPDGQAGGRRQTLESAMREDASLAECLYIVNVEAVITDGKRYLMTVRGEQESHAAGLLAFPGGKVEGEADRPDVLEYTLRREAREETGVELAEPFQYLNSTAFTAADSLPVINLSFLCRYAGGEPAPADGEAAEVTWMDPTQVTADRRCPPWTMAVIELAEAAQRAGPKQSEAPGPELSI